MAVELATAYVALTVETRNLAKDVGRQFAPVEKQAEQTGKRAGAKFSGGMGKAFAGIGGLFAGAMAGLAVKDFIGDSIAEARESQKVGALTAQVIKTTGGAAKVTAAQVGDLANSISKKTGIDDEAIQTGANLLLNFKNIHNELGKGNAVFDRATQASVDLAATPLFKGNLTGASKTLGKALNDPLKGITLLGKAGVKFSDAQKEQIKQMVKSGDVLGAQKIILGEVESSVGGAAAATATAGDKAKVTFDNLKESAGTYLLPIIDKLAAKFTTLVDEFQTGTGTGGKLRTMFKGIGKALGFLGDHMTAVKVALGVVVGGMLAWKVATIGLNTVQAIQLALLKAQTVGTVEYAVTSKIVSAATKVWAAGQWLLNAALTANPIGLVIAAIAGLIALVVLAYKKNETFRKIVDAVWAAVKSAIKSVVDWFVKTAWPWLRDTFDKIKAGFIVLKDSLGRAWRAIKDAARDAIRTVTMKFLDMVGGIISGAAKAFGWVPGLGGKLKTAASEFNKFKSRVNAALGGINDKTVNVGIKFKAGTKLAYDARHQGLAGGGLVRRAGGGPIPGPWMGPKADNVLGVSYSGVPTAWVNPREYILPVNSTASIERNHPGALEYMRKTGRLPGYAGGGLTVPTRLPTRKGINEGVDSSVLDVVAKSARMLQQAARSLGGGPGMGWRAQVAWAKANIPSAVVTSTVRHNNPASDHDKGRAIDLAGGPGMSRIFEIIRSAFDVSKVRSLYYSPKGNRQIRFNKYGNTPPHIFNTHFDHVHWAMANGGLVPKPLLFDKGGMLPMGTSLVHNATGAPEPLARVGSDGRTDLSDRSLYRLAAILRESPMTALVSAGALDSAMGARL